MSVTFDTPAPLVSWALTCGHGNGVTEHRFESWVKANGFLATELASHHGSTGHLSVCGDEYCQSGRMMTHALTDNPGPRVNVSGSNAVNLLRAMGLEVQNGSEGTHGSMDADSFKDAIATAYMTNTPMPGTYLNTRLGELLDVAAHAAATGRPVQWG